MSTHDHVRATNAVFLKKYLRERRVNPGDVVENATHTSFAGGSYIIPINDRRSFLTKYHKEYLDSRKTKKPTLFLNERYNTEYFKFFVDIDFAWDYRYASPQRTADIVKVVTRCVAKILNFVQDDVIEASNVVTLASKRTDFKIHIVFPKIVMRHDTCQLFATFLSQMVESESEFEIPIDILPYRNGSLRMLGSCKGSGLESSCERETEFFYRPICLSTGLTVSEEFSLEELVQHSILFCESEYETVGKFAGNGDGKVRLKVEEHEYFVPGKFEPTAEQSEQWNQPVSNLSSSGSNQVIMSNIPESSPLFDLLHDRYEGVYSFSATNVHYNELSQALFVSFRTKKCLIAGREHSKNRPYFIINRSGCHMKCHSQKCPGVFNHIKFEDLDIGVKTIFYKAAMSGLEQFVPVEIWSEVISSCESLLLSYGYTQPDGGVSFVDGIFESETTHDFIPPCKIHTNGNVKLYITRNGLYQMCQTCSERYPKDDIYMVTSEFKSKTQAFFKLVDAFKVRGREVFSTIGERNTVEALNESLSPIEDRPIDGGSFLDSYREGSLSERATILKKEFKNDGLRVFDDDEMNDAFIISLCGTDKDVATFINMMVSGEYVASNLDEGSWYFFRAPRWRMKEAQTNLFDIISKTTKYYEKAMDWYNNAQLQCKEKDRVKRIETITSVHRKISDVVFTKRVLTRLAYMRIDVNFESRLDAKRYLLCFSDGVYDLKTHSFRPGRKDDYLSMSVGYNFPCIDEDMRRRIEKLFEDILPDKETRNYVKKFLASTIDGSTSYELFHVLSGGGRNGKSLIADLISATLGCPELSEGNDDLGKHSYINVYEPAFLTKDRRGSSEPAPEVLDYRKARFLIGTEPDNNEKINVNWMKKLTGNDTLSARGLNSNVIVRYKPQFKLVLICNGLPSLSANDDAVWLRSRIIDFPVEFKDNPDPENIFEKQIDRSLKDEIHLNPQWKTTFMGMLIEWHRDLLLPEGLNAPEQVLRATQECKEENNPILEWWNSRTTHSEYHISSQRLRDDYLKWSGEGRMSTYQFNKNLKKVTDVKRSVRTSDGTQVGVHNRKLIEETLNINCSDVNI